MLLKPFQQQFLQSHSERLIPNQTLCLCGLRQRVSASDVQPNLESAFCCVAAFVEKNVNGSGLMMKEEAERQSWKRKHKPERNKFAIGMFTSKSISFILIFIYKLIFIFFDISTVSFLYVIKRFSNIQVVFISISMIFCPKPQCKLQLLYNLYKNLNCTDNLFFF